MALDMTRADDEKVTEATTDVAAIAADRLRNLIERTERLDEQRKARASDIKDVHALAKEGLMCDV